MFRRTVDGQTCGFLTQRLVGLASLSVQQANRSPSQPKNTPGLRSNPGFRIVRRPCFHGATARPYKDKNKNCAIFHFQVRSRSVDTGELNITKMDTYAKN